MTYPDYEFYREIFGGSEEEEVIMPFIRKGADILGGYITGCELSDNDETELLPPPRPFSEANPLKKRGFCSEE